MDDQQTDLVKLERQKVFVIQFLYWSMILGVSFLSVKYVLPVIFPFVLAYLLAWALNRPITWLTKKTHIYRGIIAALMVILAAMAVTGLLTLLVASLGSWIKEGILLLPDFIQRGVFPFVESFFAKLEELAGSIAPSVGSNLSSIVDGLFDILYDGIVKGSGALVSALGGVLTGVPGFVMRTVITIIASIFIASDFSRIRAFLVKLVPKKCLPILHESGIFFGRIMPRFLLSYALILMITFLELCIGLGILRIPKAPFVAFFVAILDILPVLGTGTVLIPWAVISLLSGQLRQGISMLVLYAVITIVRQSIEPRLVGRQIRVHPVLTFAGMVLGVYFFGAVGLFGVPLLLAFIHQLHESGIIHLRVLDKDEPDEEGSVSAR